MKGDEGVPPMHGRDRDDTEVRNWMLPLEQQEFRVPDAGRVRLPEDAPEWSGRLFVLTRWFRRIATVLTVLAAVILAVRWGMVLLR
jgi:hypothetical protein